MNLFSCDDPLWVRDFQTALRELVGEELALPAPESSCPSAVSSTKAKAQRRVSGLEGPALRAAILDGMGVRKTANPLLREVLWGGTKVGEIARSPYQPLLWVSSRGERRPFYSMTDAAVFTVAAYLEAES